MSHSMSWPQRLRIARGMARQPAGHTRDALYEAAVSAKIGLSGRATKEEIVRAILGEDAPKDVPAARASATTHTALPARSQEE